MEVIVAKSAGFCFGVKNSIDKVNSIGRDKKIKTYGPIIHNKQVVEDLRQKGIDILDDISKATKDMSVVIRSHGISKNEVKSLESKGADIVDATCPFVKNIHRIVDKKCNEGYKIIIIGDANHPEVKGISGWCENSIVIEQIEDTENIKGMKICVVAQTTFNREQWTKIVSSLIGKTKEMVVFDTICSATDERQTEVKKISSEVDAMIIIGGKDSSNSRKLYEISKENCEKSFFIETEEELDLEDIKDCNKLGITAGASTPKYLIDGVIKKINNLQLDISVEKQMEEISENDFDKYFEKMESIHVGSIVTGTVLSVSNKEMYVDIGYKSDAILEIHNLSFDGDSLKDIYSNGDVIEAKVIKMNNKDGNVVLSRLSIEQKDELEKINVFKESEEEIEVLFKEEIKGGYKGVFKNFKVFMPSSLSGTRDSKDILNKKIRVRISDIKNERKEVQLIVSRKEIVQEEKAGKLIEVFNSIKEGDEVSGEIKAIIDAGLFINIGEVDVFIPKAEASWIRNISINEEFKVGNKVKAILIKVDKENKKVSGSIKRLEKEPFENMILKYKEDDIIPVKVLRFTDFGAFVEVVKGVDGLVHISKISDSRIEKPQEALKLGQSVNAKIIKIDNETKKVELSIRDAN